MNLMNLHIMNLHVMYCKGSITITFSFTKSVLARERDTNILMITNASETIYLQGRAILTRQRELFAQIPSFRGAAEISPQRNCVLQVKMAAQQLLKS